jgi:hypothetical protein
MFYKILFILIIISSTVGSAWAENSRYRVEILVLTHLNHAQEAREARALNDFSAALDFLQPSEEPTETDTAADIPTAAPEPIVVSPDGEPPGEMPPDEIEVDPWSVVTQVEEMGPEMQEAWRRLRLSGPFRPLQYLSWEQGSEPPFPVLRIHDLETVLTEDPWAEQRLALEEASQTTVFGDTVTPAEPGDDLAEGPALPDPIAYYRLDGTASLTRSRFIHLTVTLEWREPVFDESALTMALPMSGERDARAPEPRPSAFLVHRLEQSRPVRTGQMEYFDGPVLGVLAWVSDISDTVIDSESDQGQTGPGTEP